MDMLTAPGCALVTPCDACDRTGRDGAKRACSDCRRQHGLRTVASVPALCFPGLGLSSTVAQK